MQSNGSCLFILYIRERVGALRQVGQSFLVCEPYLLVAVSSTSQQPDSNADSNKQSPTNPPEEE